MKTGMEKAGDVGSAETTPETPRNAAPEQPLSLGRVVLYGLRELESYDAAGEKVRNAAPSCSRTNGSLVL